MDIKEIQKLRYAAHEKAYRLLVSELDSDLQELLTGIPCANATPLDTILTIQKMRLMRSSACKSAAKAELEFDAWKSMLEQSMNAYLAGFTASEGLSPAPKSGDR